MKGSSIIYNILHVSFWILTLFCINQPKMDHIIDHSIAYKISIVILLVLLINRWLKISNLRETIDDTIRVYERKSQELEEKYKRLSQMLDSEYKNKNNKLVECKNRMNEFMDNHIPFSYSASLCADMKIYVFDRCENHLRWKTHPAKSAAETVKILKKETKSYIQQYNEMLYKYEFLLNIFPELNKYVDDEESLICLSEYDGFSDFDKVRDRSADYLSKEEWSKLGDDERNQLALDRYKKKNKSNWIIGSEYEMYYAHKLRQRGLNVIDFGIRKGLNDLGRDIIASNGGCVYIIQCKRWASRKLIHENVVCQLYGTSIEYRLSKNDMNLKVIPVLVTTTDLSDMAQKFAEALGVRIKKEEISDYPMIKCNINNGNKIYHLPFDQQYWNTQICKNGEFYAWSVKEAVSHGFRRAYRHSFN